jgi:hypothetical protein
MNPTEIKLKVAAEEIKEVLRKHDLAAAVALHSPGHGEYFVHINPSYSCAYMYNDNEVRFHSKRVDYKTAEEQIQKQSDTANMMNVLTDTIAFLFSNISFMSKKFDSLIGATHTKNQK